MNVFVKEIKPTANPDMMTVVFEQEVARPVTDLSSLLAFANKGNPSFGRTGQRRIAFFNFSPEMIETLGFVVGQPVKEELNASLVVHEFCEGDQIMEGLRGYYDGADKYYPRKWKVYEGTPQEKIEQKQPKMTPKLDGKDQQILTRDDQPIYRETHLSLMDMPKGDLLIKHDNKVVGSGQALREAGRRVGAALVG